MTPQVEAEMRRDLIAACMARETVGVKYADQGGAPCALVGRPVNVRGAHVVFATERGNEQALPIDCLTEIVALDAAAKPEAVG